MTLVASGGPARAGGFLVARYGGLEGNPTSGHVSTIYYNPGALTLRTGTRLYAEGILAWRRATYDRPAEAIDTILGPGESGNGTPQEALSANAGKATLDNFIASPFLGVASDLGVENLAVGLAFHVPFGGTAVWDQNDEYEGSAEYPGALDGVQRWFTIDGTIRTLYLSGAGAYRFAGPRLSVGLAVSATRSEINTVRARTTTGTDDLVNAQGGVAEGRSWIKVDGWHPAVGLGVLWEAHERVTLGVSYQSAPGFGQMELDGTLESKFGAGPSTTSQVTATQTLPDVVRAGVQVAARPQLDVRVHGVWARWSRFDKQCFAERGEPCDVMPNGAPAPGADGILANIPRDWNDTYTIQADATLHASPELDLSGGVSFDSSAVPNATVDPSLMDMSKFLVLAGARYQIGDVALSGTLTHVFYSDRTVRPRPRDALDMPLAPAQPSRVPDGAGKYTQSITLLTLGAELSF